MRRFGLALSLICILCTAYTAQAQQAKNPNIYQQLDRLGTVIEQIRQNYVDNPDVDKLINNAINGMLEGLDPHSSYVPPDAKDELSSQLSGQFGGLGIQVLKDEASGYVRVVNPMDDTPASRANLRPGDIITRVNGEDIGGLTLQQAVDKMRGPVNTPVKLTIKRDGTVLPEITLVRAVIKVHAVNAETLGPRGSEDVCYIRLNQFAENASDEVKDAIKRTCAPIPPGRLKGYVLDLRNNPGGLLDEAQYVGSIFVKRGEIVSTRGRFAEENMRLDVKTGLYATDKPLIVLINGGSASASEIVAGALQDHHRATLVGTRTFGKGSVQTIIPLGKNKGVLRLTTARYYLPSGRTIQDTGVEPDITVEQIVPEELKDKVNSEGEASLKNHLTVDGVKEQHGSQAYIPPNRADDLALKEALGLLEGTISDPAFPPKVPAPKK